jgi:hypothetical protein
MMIDVMTIVVMIGATTTATIVTTIVIGIGRTN